MSYETIDTDKAIEVFDELMKPSRWMQVLCLSGEGKMGKTHLLTKVFPERACSYARCIIIDLRNPMDTIPDILHAICDQLGQQACSGYYAAHNGWMGRPRVNLEHIVTILSHLSIHSRESIEDIRS